MSRCQTRLAGEVLIEKAKIYLKETGFLNQDITDKFFRSNVSLEWIVFLGESNQKKTLEALLNQQISTTYLQWLSNNFSLHDLEKLFSHTNFVRGLLFAKSDKQRKALFYLYRLNELNEDSFFVFVPESSLTDVFLSLVSANCHIKLMDFLENKQLRQSLIKSYDFLDKSQLIKLMDDRFYQTLFYLSPNQPVSEAIAILFSNDIYIDSKKKEILLKEIERYQYGFSEEVTKCLNIIKDIERTELVLNIFFESQRQVILKFYEYYKLLKKDNATYAKTLLSYLHYALNDKNACLVMKEAECVEKVCAIIFLSKLKKKQEDNYYKILEEPSVVKTIFLLSKHIPKKIDLEILDYILKEEPLLREIQVLVSNDFSIYEITKAIFNYKKHLSETKLINQISELNPSQKVIKKILTPQYFDKILYLFSNGINEPQAFIEVIENKKLSSVIEILKPKKIDGKFILRLFGNKYKEKIIDIIFLIDESPASLDEKNDYIRRVIGSNRMIKTLLYCEKKLGYLPLQLLDSLDYTEEAIYYFITNNINLSNSKLERLISSKAIQSAVIRILSLYQMDDFNFHILLKAALKSEKKSNLINLFFQFELSQKIYLLPSKCPFSIFLYSNQEDFEFCHEVISIFKELSSLGLSENFLGQLLNSRSKISLLKQLKDHGLFNIKNASFVLNNHLIKDKSSNLLINSLRKASKEDFVEIFYACQYLYQFRLAQNIIYKESEINSVQAKAIISLARENIKDVLWYQEIIGNVFFSFSLIKNTSISTKKKYELYLELSKFESHTSALLNYIGSSQCCIAFYNLYQLDLLDKQHTDYLYTHYRTIMPRFISTKENIINEPYLYEMIFKIRNLDKPESNFSKVLLFTLNCKTLNYLLLNCHRYFESNDVFNACLRVITVYSHITQLKNRYHNSQKYVKEQKLSNLHIKTMRKIEIICGEIESKTQNERTDDLYMGITEIIAELSKEKREINKSRSGCISFFKGSRYNAINELYGAFVNLRDSLKPSYKLSCYQANNYQ